jgi:diadenosine tetraphosphate (Ap4A) HIT family hydrolase
MRASVVNQPTKHSMSIDLLSAPGGSLLLPDRQSVLLDRTDGGHLVVLPPRPVWERSELTREELSQFSFLVAASGRAMLDVLPQLDGGCINYWEAGNWALNDAAEPRGRKRADQHRSMHLHLLGRSPGSPDPNWQWGESPVFPRYAERLSWSSGFQRLTPEECEAIGSQVQRLLVSRYSVDPAQIQLGARCPGCGYPQVRSKE